MKTFGMCDFFRNNRDIVLSPETINAGIFKRFVSKIKKYNEKYNEQMKLSLSINVDCTYRKSDDRFIFLHPNTSPKVKIEKVYDIRSLKQNNTYYGILYFMFWAQNGRKPTTGETDPYNEAIMELYAPEVEIDNPLKSGQIIKVKKSQSKMTTIEFARLVDGALAILSEMDIPEFVHRSIGDEMKKLWDNWYTWRNSDDNILSMLEPDSMSYLRYKEIHPVCELTGVGGTEFDPVVRVHLIANLQSTPFYEQPWSYIRALQSIHKRQHDEGWSGILKEFPHIKFKYERANTKALMVGKK